MEIRSGEAWASGPAEAEAAVAAGARIARYLGEPGDARGIVCEWAYGQLPASLPAQHAGAGLLRAESWSQALRFFHQSRRRSNPASLAVGRDGAGLAGFERVDLQQAVGRREAAVYFDGQRGVQGLAVFGPGGAPGLGSAAVLRYFDGNAVAVARLLALLTREAQARGRDGWFASLPARQALHLQALLPDWRPVRVPVCACTPAGGQRPPGTGGR